MIPSLNLEKIVTTAFSEYLLPILFAVAVIVFLWGVFQYRIRFHDEEAKEEGKALMFYGLLALALMFIIWGFFGIAKNALAP